MKSPPSYYYLFRWKSQKRIYGLGRMPDYIRNFVPLQETFQLESIGQNPKSLQHPRYVSLLYFRGGWLHSIQCSLVLIRMGAIIPITHWRCPSADIYYMVTLTQGSYLAPDYRNTQSQSTYWLLFLCWPTENWLIVNKGQLRRRQNRLG